MRKINVIPMVSINELTFEMSRDEVRKYLGSYKELKKGFSNKTSDDFEYCHVYYDENNILEAVEFFNDVEVYIDGVLAFPITKKEFKEKFLNYKENELKDGFINYDNSIGIYAPNDKVESILIGKKVYYSDEKNNVNNELLRFTSAGTNGMNILFPPKFEFVFYTDKFEIYKKGKLVRTTMYEDVKEVLVVKNWQNNVLINCKPIGVNIYKVSDEICNKIKNIIENNKNSLKQINTDLKNNNLSLEEALKEYNAYELDNHNYDFGIFTMYLDQAIFGEGLINNNYLSLWKKQDILKYNDLYKVKEFLPNILLIGSNGGDIAYGINNEGNYISVPFVPMNSEECKIIGKNFDDFIKYLWNEE